MIENTEVDVLFFCEEILLDTPASSHCFNQTHKQSNAFIATNGLVTEVYLASVLYSSVVEEGGFVEGGCTDSLVVWPDSALVSCSGCGTGPRPRWRPEEGENIILDATGWG